MTTRELRLVGAGGEPVDLIRTLSSHGFVDLPPMEPSADYRSLRITLRTRRGRPRTVRIEPGRRGHARIQILGPAVSDAVADDLLQTVRHVLRLDADLSDFYAVAAEDPELAWATEGAGRMLQSPSVFEDVVKTICTTNCTWSATARMVSAIVEHLGEPARGAPAEGPLGRAFPSPEAVAEAGEPFFRDIARAGYRGAYLSSLARSVASGELDLESWSRATPEELSDDDLGSRLLSVPGVGPYAAAHIMMTMGRYHRLILDSWTRPKYATLVGRKAVKDSTIERRFRQFGQYSGLAFWLFLTRDWVG